MKRNWILSILGCMVLLGLSQVWPQSPGGMSMPKVIWIYREDVKPARSTTHNKVEQGFAELWTKAQVEPFLGMEALSGNATEAMFVSGYDSFATFERDYQKFAQVSRGSLRTEYETLARQEADLVNGVRSSIALYRENLSYHPDRFMAWLPKARYMRILTMHVRPGKDESFAQGAKMYQDAYAKAEIERPWAVYQIMSGAPAGTYLIFEQLTSLKYLDEAMAMESRVKEAMGEENAESMTRDMGDVFISTQSDIYSFNPDISHVSQEFAAADPDFWNPKPKELARTSTGKKKSQH